MTLATNEQYATESQGPFPRLVPAPDSVVPRAFKAVAGGATLLNGTPVVRSTATGLWGVYVQGGANGTGTIKGFIYMPGTDDIKINDSAVSDTEQLLSVMIRGTLHQDDVNTAAIRALLGSSPTEANIKTALGALPPGSFVVQGLGSAFPA